MMSLQNNTDLFNDTNNVRVLKSRDKEKMDSILMERKNMYLENNIVNNVNSNLINTSNEKDTNNVLLEKLKKVLSKKFNLKNEDYMVLIDRFQIKQQGITRELLAEMLLFLKTLNSFNQNNSSISNKIDIPNNIIPEKEIAPTKTELDKILEERLKNYNITNETVINPVSNNIISHTLSTENVKDNTPINLSISKSTISNNDKIELNKVEQIYKKNADIPTNSVISSANIPIQLETRMNNIQNNLILKDILIDLTNYTTKDGIFKIPITDKIKNKQWYLATLKSCILKNSSIKNQLLDGYPFIYIKINDIDYIYFNEKSNLHLQNTSFDIERYIDLNFNIDGELTDKIKIGLNEDIDMMNELNKEIKYQNDFSFTDNGTDNGTDFVSSLIQLDEKGEYMVSSKTPIGRITNELRNTKKLLDNTLNISFYNFNRKRLHIEWDEGDIFLLTFEIVSNKK